MPFISIHAVDVPIRALLEKYCRSAFGPEDIANLAAAFELQISGGAPEQKYEKFGNTTVFGRPGQSAAIYVQLAAAMPALPPENIYGSGGGTGSTVKRR
jgi:hypothetical protein